MQDFEKKRTLTTSTLLRTGTQLYSDSILQLEKKKDPAFIFTTGTFVVV